MTEREYLISLGLAKEGRGRFSNAGKEALAKAKAEGKTFSDSKAVKSTPVKAKAAGGKSTAKEWHNNEVKPIVPKAERPVSWETPTPPIRLDRRFDSFTTASGIRKSYKDCCNNKGCGISIAWCHCPVPFVFDKDGETLVPLSPVESTRNLTLV